MEEKETVESPSNEGGEQTKNNEENTMDSGDNPSENKSNSNKITREEIINIVAQAIAQFKNELVQKSISEKPENEESNNEKTIEKERSL